jgi:hypothetical protein
LYVYIDIRHMDILVNIVTSSDWLNNPRKMKSGYIQHK